MFEALTIIAISAAAFIGTNLDNLVLLVALYSRYLARSTIVTAGYFSGMILIGSLSLAIGLGGVYIPIEYLGMLGVVPMMMGIIALVRLFQPQQAEQTPGRSTDNSGKAIFVAVLMTQVSNAADSVITFSLFFADSTTDTDYLIAFAFLAMTAVFASVAYYSLKHRKLSEFLDRYGPYVTPFILILVGFYIISNTASDLMPG